MTTIADATAMQANHREILYGLLQDPHYRFRKTTTLARAVDDPTSDLSYTRHILQMMPGVRHSINEADVWRYFGESPEPPTLPLDGTDDADSDSPLAGLWQSLAEEAEREGY